MAEFQEVMQQAQRMCEYRLKRGLRCNGCDAAHICWFKIRHVGLDMLCADADAVMSWAAEHPEPVYPTWIEWFKEIGIISPEQKGFHIWLHDHIPADIAQKHGIEPKEG